MKANIQDIAKKTNLSLGTVSNYLNGKKIKEKNRAAIERAISELDYKVNSFGRNLKTNRSGVIGIMVPNLDDPFAPKVISCVEQYFRDYNYAVMICDTLGREDIERQVTDFFIERRVEGVVVFPVANDSNRYNRFEENGIHAVAIDMMIDGFKGDYVGIDNRKMVKLATDYLIERGHKNIGLLCGSDGIYSADERLNGYLDSLNEAGLPVRDEYIGRGMYTKESVACELTYRLMALVEKPTAIIATNYFFTVGVIAALNQLKCPVGKNLSLFGFDSFITTEIITPKLTVVEQPIDEMAKIAGSILISRIKKVRNTDYERHLVEGKIIEGESIVNLTSNKTSK